MVCWRVVVIRRSLLAHALRSSNCNTSGLKQPDNIETAFTDKGREGSMKWTIALAVAACAALAAPCAAEDHYPSRPVKLVLPQPAGGAVDLIARALADRLAEQMGRPFIVENMPGANGSLAGGNVARSPSDGYTLMLAVDSNLVINPSLYHTLTYDPFKDFAPISIIARLNMVLVANPKISANSVQELIAYAKAHPNKLNYAEIGIGSAMHM